MSNQQNQREKFLKCPPEYQNDIQSIFSKFGRYLTPDNRTCTS
jgi:hypothetical protein